MNNYSINNELLNFNLSTKDILIIDVLYLDNIRENIDFSSNKFSGRKGIITIEQMSFPYSGGTLVGFLEVSNFNVGEYEINPKDFEHWNDFEATENEVTLAQQKHITTFGSDTGQLIISDLYDFPKLIEMIDYDDLVEHVIDENLESYCNKIWTKTNLLTWGIISLPEGGGSFKYDRKKIEEMKTTGKND